MPSRKRNRPIKRPSNKKESQIIFINDCTIGLYPGTNTDVKYRCDECNYEIEIFNENLLLSWQMHVQETYHIDTVNEIRELQQKQLERLERENDPNEFEIKRGKGKRNKNSNGKKTDEKSNENNIDDQLEEKWSRKRVIKSNYGNSRENFEYQNLAEPRCCKKSDVMIIFDMFPSVEMINNWGYTEVMKAEKEKLKEARCQIVVEELENAIKQFYVQKFTVEIFGSRITGLATETTNDLDVYINTGGLLNNNENAQHKFMSRLSKILGKNKKGEKNENIVEEFNPWTQVVYIEKTRTPIIKAKLKKCNMSCDISVKNGLSTINTELLKSLFQHVPIMRQLILILRFWLKNWNWSKIFTNYAISIMTLFYLQNEKVLPSVCAINKECKKLRNENGWPVYDYKSNEKFKTLMINQEGMSLVENLYRFFKFYAEFNYETDVISTYIGHILKKSDFENNGVNLPEELDGYKQFVRNMDNEECLYDTPIVIQDPIEQCYNITRNIRKSELQKFKVMCELSCYALGDRVLKSVTI